MQRAAVTGVVPELGHDFQADGLGGLHQFAQQELTAGIVKHANALGLGQDMDDQAQLTLQRRVAPEQADFRRVRVAQALPGLEAADAQHQSGRPLGILQAPVEAGQVEEDQTGAGGQVPGRRQLVEGGKADLVVGALLGKGLSKGAHTGTVLGGREQDAGTPGRRCQQQARQQQAAAPQS